ncbi:hypothetical protein Plano_0334 [Planococcus sp. PAMC 21323]|uniref:hypothetical protein n=1 Tax=Planococcus sp. PAMC 21323 TaxID=1526927 RepID=UPI0005706D27|nr:hypothetical protein [Planococcus sp. PAMC 21323]AIY04299.1 hypothetical protein Plano_0334 [Planococcus sp. PAMC 21323]
MKPFAIVGSIGFTLLLSACGVSPTTQGDLADFQVTTPQAETIQDDFTYRLVTEKEQYTEGESIDVYAELEYTGDSDSIEIFHAASPFYFLIYEETRDFSVSYTMNEPLLVTILTKGEPLKEAYIGIGSYSVEDDQAYVNFVQRISDNNFPFGYYKMTGHADFFTQDLDGSKIDYDITAQIDFKVND